MRNLLLATLAGLFTLTFATEADARKRSSSAEGLVFVAPTNLTDADGNTLSLCMLTETQSALFVNFWVSAEAYAMAKNNCDSTQYFAVSDESFADLQSTSEIPADLPMAPKLNTSQMISGMWGLGLGAGLLGFAGFGAMRRGKRKKERQAEMGNATPQARQILDVMCHAAKSDGEIDPGEVTAIVSIAEQLTGEKFSPESVNRMIELSEAKLDKNAFKKLCKGLSGDFRLLAMKGALTVAAADGVLAGAEKNFIGGLAQTLGISGEQINILLAEIAGAQKS